jgi:fatty-acyl-CoA synthase
MLACTSGTTGSPKIIELEHQGFIDFTTDMANLFCYNNSSVMMMAMPLYHLCGLGVGLQPVIMGGTIMYQPQFSPEKFLKLIEDEKVTVMLISATLAKILISTPSFDSYNLSSLKTCIFAGEFLPDHIANLFYGKLTPYKIPDEFIIVDEIPKDLGKVQLRKLQQ